MYKLDGHTWVTLEDWVVDDAIAMYKGNGASLKAALQAYKCNAFLSVCHLLVCAFEHSPAGLLKGYQCEKGCHAEEHALNRVVHIVSAWYGLHWCMHRCLLCCISDRHGMCVLTLN